MGWLYMKSLKGYSGPRQYLDAQYTYERPERRSRVLRSTLVGKRVYYAAVETVRVPTGELEAYAAVCLYRWNPRDPEGYIFGYKDMDETVGPYECECPARILDLLTPTTSEYAVQWRDRCRVLLEKPMPRPGQIIVFDEPVTFTDGRIFDRTEVVSHARAVEHAKTMLASRGSNQRKKQRSATRIKAS